MIALATSDAFDALPVWVKVLVVVVLWCAGVVLLALLIGRPR